MKNQESIENELNFSGTSDEYDIEIKFDADSLGASVYTLPEVALCQGCNLSIGEERLVYDGCKSIGHKHCFNKLSHLRGESQNHIFCMKSGCRSNFQQKHNQLAVQRAHKLQADKMLSNTASRLLPVVLGDNVRVPIPKVDRSKLVQPMFWV